MSRLISNPLLAGLLTLPWLWPHTFGPVAAVEPYLVSVALAAIALALWPVRGARRATRIAAWAWLAAALASSVIALLQYFDLEAPLFPWVDIAAPGQAFGNLRQPNQLATLLVIGALALRWLARAGRLPGGHAAWMGALLMAALAATASRVGLVELLACGALLLWWALAARQPRQGRRVAAAVGVAVALYVLAALALPLLAQSTEGIAGRDIAERLRTAESTCGSRLILWRNVLHLIALKPWTGWGWGELGYAHYITLYDGPRFCHILDNAHNLPLHLAVELGVPVALLACALAAWLAWRGRPWAERQPARQLAWGVLLAIGIHSLVEYPLWYGPFQIAAALCIWLLWATRAGQASQPDDEAAAWGQVAGARAAPWRYAVAAAMLCAVVYAGWDYHRISQLYLPAEQRSALWRDDPLGHARQSWLYAGVVRFAEVTSYPATRDNAAWLLPEAQQTLHYSSEPSVIIRVIESASLQGRDDLVLAHLARFRAAFPREYQAWMDDNERLLKEAQELLQSQPASAAPDGQ
ncbi:MAG: Wzy polymerase domain-containing protein [Desulfovibrionaceae bacterium]|nr:Wzy polymerase domain-containing protein [Desulfovibrionaceae bacterium]